MFRSFVVAFVTIVVVVLSGAKDDIVIAQQPAAAARGASSVPIQFTGATPGTSIELIMNAGKVADVTINSTGQGASVLDLSNMGKVQLQVYVDVCQDGKVVKVLVVSGQPPPEDNCKRRVAGAAWWSDCGVTRITLDLTKFNMRVIGCGSMLSDPKVYGSLIGGVVGTVAIIASSGGGSSTGGGTIPVATQPPNTQQPAAVAPPTVVLPPSVPTLPDPTPSNQTSPVTANGNYSVTGCAVADDRPNHDPTLRLCQGMNQTATAQEGSLTIRHPSPFIDVTGPNYNTTTGAFDISGTGSIAGFNGVAARAVGTVNNQTGRITFNYTLGSNGAFPGGQPITYSITLQKR
jgi:hypothetical protein